MPRKLHAALLDGDSYEWSPEWLPKMSQETTKEKGTTCSIYFHTVRRTELLLLLHPRVPSLLPCCGVCSLTTHFQGKPGLGSPGKNLRHTTPSHSIIPASSPVLSLPCLDALMPNTVLAFGSVSLSAEPAVTMVTSHALLCLSPVPHSGDHSGAPTCSHCTEAAPSHSCLQTMGLAPAHLSTRIKVFPITSPRGLQGNRRVVSRLPNVFAELHLGGMMLHQAAEQDRY